MRNLYYLLKMVRLSLPYKARKYITILLFIMLGFFLFKSAYAVYDPNPKHSKWFHESIVNDPTVKSTVEVKAARTYPVTVYDPATAAKNTITKPQRSTIKLAAKTNNVGKSLFKRSPTGLITQAMIAILGKSVDWVLDPENNSVKYKDPAGDVGAGGSSSSEYLYKPGYDGSSLHPSAMDACSAAAKHYDYGTPYLDGFSEGNPICYGSKGQIGVITRVPNPAYNPNPSGDSSGSGSDDYKSVPMPAVAQKVIDAADAGDPAAQQLMKDTGLDMLEAGLLDTPLNAAAQPKEFGANESDPLSGTTPDPSTDPDGSTPNPNPNPEGEGKPFELPPFCEWASKVCDFIDWMQMEPEEPEDGAGDIEIEKPDPDMHVGILERLYINMPAQCPPDPVLEFMGAKIPFPMSVFCQFASMMKPLILLFAYIKGLSIIGNGLN